MRDPAALATFRTSGELTVRVPLEQTTFRGLERVRLRSVRAWVEGASCPEGRCLVQVRTSGDYADRLNGSRFAFQGPALWRVFEYEPDGTGRGRVLVDGELADEFAFAYFEPTPFTEWTVRLAEGANPRVDLSQVSALTLEWSGSAVGAL